MSALLNRTPVLWFLFLFDLAVAVGVVAATSKSTAIASMAHSRS